VLMGVRVFEVLVGFGFGLVSFYVQPGFGWNSLLTTMLETFDSDFICQ
jgi:hypothetical protein